MRHFTKISIFSYFLLACPLTALAQTDPASPCAVFDQQVEKKDLAAGAAQWAELAKSLGADPLFAQLGLDGLTFSSGNQLAYEHDLKIGDDTLDLQGTLNFDPAPADGAPVATLSAKTQSRTQTDLVEIGQLHATAAELYAAVYKENGAYKVYARLLPYFTNHSKEPLPCIMLSKGKSGLDFAVTGGDLKLKEIYPPAGRVKFFDQFALTGVVKQGKELDVLGAVNGKELKAEFENGQDYLLVTGKSLVLADFIPEAGAAPFLNGFAFESFSLAGGTLTVSGTQNGKKVSVWRGADKNSFAVAGDGLKLSDFIPAAAQVPCVSALALDSVRSSDTELAITGRVNGRPVAISGSLTEKKVGMTGAGLSLPACLPLSLNLPFLKLFSFGGLFQWPDRLEIDGTLNGKDVKLVWIFAPDTVTVTGESILLSDVIPAAAKVRLLQNFAFLSLDYSKAALKVNGTAGGKAVAVVQDNTAKTFTVTGDALTLGDLVPETAGVAYLRRFDFKEARQRPGGLLVVGDVDGKAVSVESDKASGSFTVTGDGLKLADFVPEASQVAFLGVFALDSVRSSPDEFLVSGKVNNKAVTVDDHLTSNIFTVTGADLKLADFFPETKDLPALSAFAFDSLTHTADALTVAGKVNGKTVTVARLAGAETLTVKGDALKLADFVPSAAKVDFLNNFAFLSLTWFPGTLEVAGTINSKNVLVTLDKAAKTFTASGSALQLADFVPAAAKLPYLARFDLNKVQERPDGVLVAGDVDGKAVSVDYNKAAASFKVTGDDLQLKDFVPQAAGISYLDNFKFTGLLYSADSLEVTGTVNNKAVTVKKALNAPDFSVTGDGLKLADFVPGTEQVPCVNEFALDSVTRSEEELGVAGRVNGKPVSISDSFADNRVAMTGPGLSLPACLPLSLNLPFLNLFSFDGLFHWPDRLEVNGKVNGKAVKVVWIFAPDTVTVTGDSVKLADAIPAAARVPFLNNFAFLELDYSKDQLSVNGTIRGKAVSVKQDNAAKTFKVTGDDLKLADFVPEAAGVPFLKAFAFDALAYGQTAVTVEGKLNSKAVSVTKAFGPDGSFTAKGDGLTLGDIVPEAAGIKAFDALAIDLVAVSPAAVEVAGKLSGKAIKFSRTRGDKPVSTITADGLKLGDIFAPLAGVPAVNAVAMDKLSLDGASVEAEARLNGVKVAVAAHADQNADGAYAAIYFDRLGAATFIPAAQGHVVNDLALERALFVVQPAGSPARQLAATDLPGSLGRLLGWGSETLPLADGVNFAAWLNVAKSGALARAFGAAGLPQSSVLLKGTVAPDSFKSMTGGTPGAAASLSDADKQALLAGLNLSVAVPLPSLPAIAGMVTVRGPVTLSLGGDARSKSSLWANVPAPIAASKPAGDLNVSLQFGLDITGAGINEKLDALVSLDKGARAGYSLLAVYEGAWKQPFGIQGLTLDNGGFEFSLEKSPDAAKSGLAFFATAQIGQKNVAVAAQLKRDGGKLSLDYFQLDGQFRPGDFPGGKNIPYGDKFELDQLKLSTKGIEAKTIIAGKKVDAYLFDAGAAGAPNWVFAAAQKNFNVTELLPVAKAIKPLAAMTIPDAALIVSEKGLKNADRNALGVIAKDLFDRILGKSAVKINIPDGIGVLAAFDAGAMGPLGKGLSRIGVHDDAVVMGAVTGVFAGNPGVLLSLTMDNPGDPKGLPKKVVSFKPGVPPAYFIQWSGTELDAGLRIPLLIKAGKETLAMDADLELKFAESGVGVKVLAEMDGTWRQPFGIKGLLLKNVKMDLAVNETGEVQFGLAGDQLYGRCSDPKSKDCLDLDMAMSVKIPLEDGLPDGVAFSGKASSLGLPALVEITETITGAQAGSLAALPAPFFEIKNAQVAFATPGASDPQLGLVGEGFAFAGTFVFMNRELGQVKGSGGAAGTAIKGTIGDIDLEIIKFTGNSIDFALGAKPHYAIDSNVNLLGTPQKVKLDIEPPYFEFDLTEKLGAFGQALLTVRMDGFDLKKGTFDKNAGISVTGVFQSTLIPWMKDEVKKGVEELRDSAKAKFDEDTKALQEAKAKVNEIDDKIEKIKKEDQKAKDRAEEALESARRRVNSLQDKHDHENHEAHHCGSRWTHWACSPGWRIAAASTWVVLEVANGALTAAEKAVAAASNLDPRIAVLIAQRDVERAALSIAESVVKVTEDIEDFVLKELETVLERAVSSMPLEIDEAIIVGDLRDMVTHNDPMVLDLKFKIAGAPMHEFFAVKVPDSPENAEFDSTSFALLPALALDTLTEEALKKISADASRWVHSHIATSLAAANEKVRAQVEAEEEKYAQVLASFDNGTAKYRKAFEEQTDEHLSLVQAYQVSDTMPDSLEYSNIYLAIGHSDHCLGVSKDGLSVVQMVCKDADTEMWSTVKLDTDTAKGYVQLKNKGLCLKARNGDKADNFEPLTLATCDGTDRHEQWKIHSSDGFYDEIVNRFAQKCLHFNKEDANPETSYAVWAGCYGADSQTFRDITDAEKPTWHKVNSLVEAGNGLCLDVAEDGENAAAVTPDKKELKLLAHKCGDGSERFNFIEEVNGDIRLVHVETGLCVYPQENAQTLALRACDRGQDMFWRLNDVDGSADQFFNPARNSCMILPAPPKGSTQDAQAGLADCKTVPNDATLMDFVK